jgi:predicted nucleic acid-binding protein
VAILLDASAIVAAADRADLNHGAALAWFRRADEPLLIGALTLGEVDVVLQRELSA